MPSRLTTRLVLSHLFVIAMAMALLSFLLLSLVQGYFEQALEQSLTTQARLTAQALMMAGASTNLTQAVLPPAQNAVQQTQTGQIAVQVQNLFPNASGLENSAVRLSAELDTRVQVLDAHGIVQADSAGTGRGLDLSSDAVIAGALGGQEQLRSQENWVNVAMPLRRDDRIVGVVYLGQPTGPMLAVLADLRLRLLVSAAIALLLSGIVGWVLARAIARPVRELTLAANHLAQGDFDYPIHARAPDELGELARTFRGMSADLQQMLQARTDLVSNVSHELRTPLTAIKGLVETLRDGAVDDMAARDQFLASIENETDRLIRLVNDLLLLSRADAQALPLHREQFDACALARDCAADLEASAAAREVTITVEGPSAQVFADPDRVHQVLVNLLDNALRYSPLEGTVRVHISSTARDVVISVQDCGPGIPAADQARVFERFYRGDRSRARSARAATGAGLGLAIARALVQAHGGQIELESREGQGTTVRFTLPAS